MTSTTGSRRFRSSPTRQSAAWRREGFTLWELLLVLAILMTVAAISWPSVSAALRDRRLKQAAQIAWSETTATRLRAIEVSLAYQFRYEIGGPRWISVPWDVQTQGNVLMGTMGPGVDSPVSSGTLPEGFAFQPPPGQTAGAQRLSTNVLAGLPDANALAGVNWSAPLVFFGDGSSYDTGLMVVDSNGKGIPLAVRGLTGEVLVGPVQQNVAGPLGLAPGGAP